MMNDAMNKTTKRVAVFGGSFNPPHKSHVEAVKQVLASGEVDEVVVVPAFAHCLKASMLPFETRYAMCKLAFAGVEGVTVSRVEQELGGQSRTLRTLQHLAAEHPEWELRLVLGADCVAESHKWFGFDEIKALAPLFVLARNAESMSSTKVRDAMRSGLDVRSMVPASVADFMVANELYADAA